MKPRFFIVGDPHGYYDEVLRLAHARRPDAIIFLGDLELPAPASEMFARLRALDIVTKGIVGNHDTDEPVWFERANDPGFNIHARVEDICGIRVAGLGGVFRQKFSWYPPAEPIFRSFTELDQALASGRLTPKTHMGHPDVWVKRVREVNRSGIFPAEYDALLEQTADILVTHEAPGMHQYGFAAISELAALTGVRRAFHGHHHQSITYTVGDDGVHWHGVGLREIVEIDGLDSEPVSISGGR